MSFPNLPKGTMMQHYLDALTPGTEILASDFAKMFNLSNVSRAGKELGIRDDMNKVDIGVYVKL